MLEPPSAAAGTGEVEARLDSIDRRIEAFADTLTTLVRQQELIQGAVRQLGSRVTEAATSLSAPRVRELYGRLVLLYDLVAPTPAHLSPDAAEVCQVVATQIEQFLEVTGFQRIPTDGAPFNRDLHKPVRVVRAENPEVGGRIVATVRNGFCSELGVLRPAEVVLAVAESATLQAQTSDQASALGS
jgi:molecular chaperone GrpE (heat shock protein)